VSTDGSGADDNFVFPLARLIDKCGSQSVSASRYQAACVLVRHRAVTRNMDTSSSPSAHRPRNGRRERNKADKLKRIREAATELFLAKGYDNTTTRAIADLAGVGMGTLFIYAPTKRDLLFLIVNDDLESVVRRATSLVQPSKPLVDNLLRVFRAHYRYYSERPTLSRLTLREMMFYAEGPEAGKFLKTRERLILLLDDIVRFAIERKEIAPREDSKLITWVIFSIYQIEIRHWLSGNKLDLPAGVEGLRRQLVLLVEGLSPRR
jgi:AcrR family transcriptional regulator